MGQHPAPGKLITNWYQNQTQPDVICNKYTKDQYQRHYVLIQDKRQLEWYDRRMKEHYPYICRVVCYHTADFTPNDSKQQNDNSQSQSKTYFVYTDRMLPIQVWSIDTSLCILKGFNRLITNQNYQYFHIENNMIGQNQHGIVKVWVNSNPASNSALKPVSSQQQMLANIAGILMKHDKYSASLLINCKTFKQAIKNISKKKLDDAHFSQMYSCREDIKQKYEKKQYVHEKKDDHLNWHFGNPNEAYIGKTNAKNNQFWTIRNNHDQRQYISQGKRQVNNLIDMINQNRNASSTAKNNPGSLQRPSLHPNYNYQGYNNYNQPQSYPYHFGPTLGVQPIPQSYPLISVASPKGRQGFEFLEANLDKKNQNNKNQFKVGYNQRQKVYKIQNKIDKNPVEISKIKNEKAIQISKSVQQRKKYTSTYIHKMQQKQPFNEDDEQYPQHINEIEDNDNQIITYSPINSNYRPKNTPNPKKSYLNHGQLKGVFYEDPNRIQTCDNIHDAFKFQQMNTQRNKTQDFQKQIRSDVPSFIPKKKEQHLGDNLQNPALEGKTYSVSGKQQNYERIEKKKSEVLQQGKKEVRSEKRTKKIQQQQDTTEKKQQRPSVNKVIESKSKRFINNMEDAGLSGKKIMSAKNQQKQQKKPVNLVLPSYSHKTSGSQQFANQKKNAPNIGQSMSKSSGEGGKIANTDKQLEKKTYNECQSFGEQQEDFEKQIQDKRKVKQQRNIQWKKQFGTILCLDSQEPKSPPRKGEAMYKSGNFVLQQNNIKQKRNATQKYGPVNQGSKKQITLTGTNNKQNYNKNQQEYDMEDSYDKVDTILNNLSTDNSQVIRDKMIKQKVQRKKADFADLKQRAMKILY